MWNRSGWNVNRHLDGTEDCQCGEDFCGVERRKTGVERKTLDLERSFLKWSGGMPRWSGIFRNGAKEG